MLRLRLSIFITKIIYLWFRPKQETVFESKLRKSGKFKQWRQLCSDYEIANSNNDSFSKGMLRQQILDLMDFIKRKEANDLKQ